MFVNHHENIAKKWGLKPADNIPSGWTSVTKRRALENLAKMYNISDLEAVEAKEKEHNLET